LGIVSSNPSLILYFCSQPNDFNLSQLSDCLTISPHFCRTSTRFHKLLWVSLTPRTFATLQLFDTLGEFALLFPHFYRVIAESFYTSASVRIVAYSRGGACPTDCGSTPHRGTPPEYINNVEEFKVFYKGAIHLARFFAPLTPNFIIKLLRISLSINSNKVFSE